MSTSIAHGSNIPQATSAVRPPIEAPDLYRRLLDSMIEGVCLSTADGMIIYTNPAEERMFGYEPGGLIGKHVTALNALPDGENARVVAAVIDELKSCGSWVGE